MKKKSTKDKSLARRSKQSQRRKLVRTTSAELAQMEDTSDWERVERLTDAAIDQAITDDPDAPPVLDDAFWRNAEILTHVMRRARSRCAWMTMSCSSSSGAAPDTSHG
jgi:hypothetical protein